MKINMDGIFKIVKKAAVITGVILTAVMSLEKLRDVEAYYIKR